MKHSLGISNFLEEISSLSHSIVFLYFIALISEEGFLISPCCSLELCIQMGISFLFSFAFCFSYFHSYLKGLLRQPFCCFAFVFSYHIWPLLWGFPVAQSVKNLPAMQETWIQSLGWEDSLEKEMGILAWKISWTEDPGGLQYMGLQRVRHDWVTNITTTCWGRFLVGPFFKEF